MKQNKFFILAAAAALFVGCSSDDSISEKAAKQAPQEVGFSAYMNRGTTRAGQTGVLTNDQIKWGSHQSSGFAVFGYYTDADDYDQNFTPNFMYNQQVTFVNGEWKYSPIKYWPNEFGDKALSDDIDQVSFFAYAPYVEVNPSTGKVTGDETMGIVGMKKNNATGDPMIKYISTFFTDEQVDLVWGTVADADWDLKNETTQPTLALGLPWLNVQHPTETSDSWTNAQKVNFDFKHALAALNVTVDTKANSTSAASPAADTKVYIRSVTFEGFDTKGALNLNNITAGEALWFNFDCHDELNKGCEVTIQDGRKDGKEGISEATKEYAAINPDFVQSTEWGSTSPAEKPGVTGAAANLFKAAGSTAATKTDPIYVIPNGDKMKVTIEYDVLTADANLAGTLNDGKTKGSVVKNVITRYITTTSEAGSVTAPTATTGTSQAMVLENGKKYTINLHLGLNSVEFDAAVTGWATGVTGGADLPHNN